MTNPYKKYKKDPFEIARLTGMVGAWFEAFKKISCAGMDGRAKSFEQDIKEASFTVGRIITDLEDGHFYPGIRPQIRMSEVLEMYAGDMQPEQEMALIDFLHAFFCPGTMHYLYSCRLKLDKVLKNE